MGTVPIDLYYSKSRKVKKSTRTVPIDSPIDSDLRSQCFTQISSYARNNHKNKIDLVTEFNIAVGNIDIDE